MRRTWIGVAAIAAGVVVARRLASRGGVGDGELSSWQAVTIACEPEAVKPGGRLVEPLAHLGPGVEVRIQPAATGEGTEVAVRQPAGEPNSLATIWAKLRGDDPRVPLRSALEDTKQLIEMGEVRA